MNYGLGDFPVTEKAATEIVSLPMFPTLTAGQQARVVEEILNFTSMTARKQVENEPVILGAANRRA
jgi:dTDP-4-amino-4,6-dideoxygalactose transaminase